MHALTQVVDDTRLSAICVYLLPNSWWRRGNDSCPVLGEGTPHCHLCPVETTGTFFQLQIKPEASCDSCVLLPSTCQLCDNARREQRRRSLCVHVPASLSTVTRFPAQWKRIHLPSSFSSSVCGPSSTRPPRSASPRRRTAGPPIPLWSAAMC